MNLALGAALWVLVSVTNQGLVTVSQPMSEAGCQKVLEVAKRIGPQSSWKSELPYPTTKAECARIQ